MRSSGWCFEAGSDKRHQRARPLFPPGWGSEPGMNHDHESGGEGERMAPQQASIATS
jgi:hypothetical protein